MEKSSLDLQHEAYKEMMYGCNYCTWLSGCLYISRTHSHKHKNTITLCWKWKLLYGNVNNFSSSSPQVSSPPHLTDPWKKPCRSSQQEQVRWLGTDAPHILSHTARSSLYSICSRWSTCCFFLLLSSAGLHETLALLTSQLRPDANHKEDMVFLKDVFSERSLGYLMKVRNSYCLHVDVICSSVPLNCIVHVCNF